MDDHSVKNSKRTRVLIAEDSSTSRDLLSAILRDDGRFEIVGTAINGQQAVEMTRQLRPDVVMMDIYMPLIDGITATRRIMEEVPTPIVVVTASVLLPDVAVTLNALNAGALAVLRKPSGPHSPGFAEDCQRIVSTVRAMAGVKVFPHAPDLGEAGNGAGADAGVLHRPIRAVAIAASTGGPATLRRILARLPASLPVPVLVVQHIANGFGPGLAAWLGAATPLRVKTGEDGESLDAGTVFIAPDGQHLGMANDLRIVVSDAPAIGTCKPSASFLFKSVADSFGASTMAVILTGMGADGTEGLRAVRAAGGVVLAQDEQSCVVFSMPWEAIKAGLVDAVLSPDAIADQIARIPANG